MTFVLSVFSVSVDEDVTMRVALNKLKNSTLIDVFIVVQERADWRHGDGV